GPVDGLPAVPVLAGAAARAHGAFIVELLLHGREYEPVRIALGGDRGLAPLVLAVPGVVPLVDVDHLEVVKVDGVRTVGEGAAEIVGIEDLQRERLPASGRPAREDAGPRLRDRAEVLLDVGDQLRRDGLAV